MLQEIMVMTGVVLIGVFALQAVLYKICKGDLTYRLYIRLAPGLFVLLIDSFIVAKIGIFNLWSTLVGFVVACLSLVWVILFATKSVKDSLKKIIAHLLKGTAEVAVASSKIAASSQSLAEGSAQQASSIEEISSSLEEMSSMTRQNAENSGEAKAKMIQAKEIVEKVEGHMDRMAEAMRAIIRTSEETGKIIKTIDEIAFQTNLLALNAAVEAARAGEAGAGFAVVADEVRNLAMRAAEAARSTNGLIENTIKAVQEGGALTSVTREAVLENVKIAGTVRQLIDEIAGASGEQAQGIEQINRAVAEMEKVIQHAAANADESAGISQDMDTQARQMKVYVADIVQVVDSARISE